MPANLNKRIKPYAVHRKVTKLVQMVLATCMLFTHSGELYVKSCKEKVAAFALFQTSPFVFILARSSAVLWRRKLFHPWPETVFIVYSAICYGCACLYIYADLFHGVSRFRTKLNLCMQFTPLSENMIIIRLVIGCILTISLLYEMTILLARLMLKKRNKLNNMI